MLAAALMAAALGFSSAPLKAPPRVLRVPVSVEDQGPALRARDMHAVLDGSAARVLGLKGPGDDLLLMIVLDLVDDLSLVGPAKEALEKEIEGLPAHTWVGLLRAQDGLSVLADPTPDRAVIQSAVANLPVSGSPGLLDTIDDVERIADASLARSTVRVAVLYVTDSDVHNYRQDFSNPVINSSDSHDLSRKFPEALIQEKISRLEASLAQRQTPLSVVHLRYRSERLNEAYQNGLKRLAEATGGTAVFCHSSAEIPEAIAGALERISRQYSLLLELPGASTGPAQVQLESAGARSLNYRARFVLNAR